MITPFCHLKYPLGHFLGNGIPFDNPKPNSIIQTKGDLNYDNYQMENAP